MSVNLAILENVAAHNDVVVEHAPVSYFGQAWDLSHLKSFAFRLDPGLGFDVDVVVLFSCHCFTHSFKWDTRARAAIPTAEIYGTSTEARVLDPSRYELSRQFLRPIVRDLPQRKIIVAGQETGNFMAWEMVGPDGATQLYAVFLDAEKDKARKRRVILRVQSAYVLDNGLTRRQKDAKKVGWETLIRAAYQERKIRS